MYKEYRDTTLNGAIEQLYTVSVLTIGWHGWLFKTGMAACETLLACCCDLFSSVTSSGHSMEHQQRNTRC